LGSLSKLDVAHENFHSAMKTYFRSDFKGRALHLMKYESMPKIATYIGPSAFTRLTVVEYMMNLLEYYILGE